MALSLEQFKNGCESLRNRGNANNKPTLFVTESQIKRMIKEGEMVDQEKKTINNVPYILIEK